MMTTAFRLVFEDRFAVAGQGTTEVSLPVSGGLSATGEPPPLGEPLQPSPQTDSLD